MPDEIVSVPAGDPVFDVRVIALFKGKEAGPFAYLQGMRSGLLKAVSSDPEKTELAREYHRKKHQFFEMLAAAVPEPISAVLSPPSDNAWQSQPYRQAIIDRYSDVIDLTDAVKRPGGARSGKDASLAEIVEGLTYVPTGLEQHLERLVIVDDTFRRGTTVAAIISLLRAHGLPETCEIILACPLWLDTAEQLPRTPSG